MSGIGVIIILLQTLPFMGSAVAEGGPVGAVQALPDAINNINISALAIAAVTLGVGIVWPTRLNKFVPSTLAALAAGTALGVLWLTDTPVIGNVPTGLPPLELPDLALRRGGAVGAAGVDHRAARLHRQPADIAGRRLDDPHAP